MVHFTFFERFTLHFLNVSFYIFRIAKIVIFYKIQMNRFALSVFIQK